MVSSDVASSPSSFSGSMVPSSMKVRPLNFQVRVIALTITDLGGGVHGFTIYLFVGTPYFRIGTPGRQRAYTSPLYTHVSGSVIKRSEPGVYTVASFVVALASVNPHEGAHSVVAGIGERHTMASAFSHKSHGATAGNFCR